MNFGAIKSALRRMVGNPETSQVSDSTMGFMVNESIRMMSLEYKFREVRCIASFETTVGTPRYMLPSDLSYIRQIWDDTNKRRLVGPFGDRKLSDLPIRSNGWPTSAIRERGWIQLDPPPSDVITIKFTYVKVHVDIEDDNAIPALPLDWHYAVAMHARWLYYSENQDYPKAQNAYNMYKLWVKDHPTPIERETDEADLPAAFDELGLHASTRKTFDTEE